MHQTASSGFCFLGVGSNNFSLCLNNTEAHSLNHSFIPFNFSGKSVVDYFSAFSTDFRLKKDSKATNLQQMYMYSTKGSFQYKEGILKIEKIDTWARHLSILKNTGFVY